ncbi:MAG: bacterial transcriptional activator domain-containing protein [Proteobacteria bacterium]|nr:bacterial transcriptional activator domain-containing protein [Pseudomonadota bacterium]
MHSDPGPLVWGALRTGWRASHDGRADAWPLLSAARRDLRAQGDATGTALAAAALLVTGQLEGDYRQFAACLADVDDLAADALDAGDALIAEAGRLSGLLCLRPNDPALDGCVQRVVAHLEAEPDANAMLAAARLVLFYAEPRERRELGLRVNALIEARAGDPEARPYRRAHWLWFWSRFARYAKEPRQAERADADLRALVDRHDLRRLRFLLTIVDIEAALPRGDLRQAEDAVERAEALVDATRLRELMMLAFSRTRLARLRGDADAALLHAERGRRIALELQVPGPTLAVYIVNEAQARLQTGDTAGARAAMAEALPLVPAGFADEIQTMIDAIVAWEAWQRGASGEAAERFAALWRGLRARRSYDLFEGYPAFAARLASLALQLGIETDFVRHLIEKNGLVAPADAPDPWPWPLRVHALGGFRIERHGSLLASTGKAQKRPLALLQAIVAIGATDEGRAVDVDILVNALWSEDGSDPKASFDSALSRLRRLLGIEGALRVADGRLALDARIVWCDVAALERCFDATRRLPPQAAAERVSALADRLIALYRGPLLAGAAKDAWCALPRDQLAARFARAIVDLGRRLEAHGAFDAAQRLYAAGLAQDVLAEPIYRALMRCHLALGERGEALRVYRRCRDVLLASLNIAPTAETIALAESAGGAAD